jgi:hypothetical protein
MKGMSSFESLRMTFPLMLIIVLYYLTNAILIFFGLCLFEICQTLTKLAQYFQNNALYLQQLTSV